jgi:hypothetical protein
VDGKGEEKIAQAATLMAKVVLRVITGDQSTCDGGVNHERHTEMPLASSELSMKGQNNMGVSSADEDAHSSEEIDHASIQKTRSEVKHFVDCSQGE